MFLEKNLKTFLKTYFQSQLLKWKYDIKIIRRTIEEVIGKTKYSSDFPNKLRIRNIKVTDKILISDRFSEFFVNISTKLAPQIPQTKKYFWFSIDVTSSAFQEIEIMEIEFKVALLEMKKAMF